MVAGQVSKEGSMANDEVRAGAYIRLQQPHKTKELNFK